MKDQEKHSTFRFKHLTEFQHLRYRRKRKLLRGDQPDIRDCDYLKIDTMKNWSPSMRSKKSPRGFVKVEDGKHACQERGTVRATLPCTSQYTFENLAIYRKWHAIRAITELSKSASDQEVTIIIRLVAELLPSGFLMVPLNLWSIGQCVELLSYLGLRQLEDLADLLKLGN